MRRRFLLCCTLLSPLVLLVVVTLSGLRINRSHSFPPGLYWVASKTPARNDLVFFLPPHRGVFDLAKARGYIGSSSIDSTGSELMLKRLVAEAGDVVSIDASGVTVNGRAIRNSMPQAADQAGRPLPVCRLTQYRLEKSEILAMSDYSPLSFDARYFGPIPVGCIQSVVTPILTW
jgi:conjugative transfer signal peptidase TraF